MVNVPYLAESTSVPAPTGGLNTRNPEALMPPEDAITLQNCFPGNSRVELRRGFAEHTTSGLGSSTVQTLLEYVQVDGDRFLVAAANSEIHDVTSSGASTDITGTSTPTSDVWQGFNINNVLVMLNGNETPQSWGGTGAAADLTITGSGLTSSNLITGTVYGDRAYYVEKATANLWYAAAGAHSGACTKLDLRSLLRRGGYILFIVPWTTDSGDGGKGEARCGL